MDDTEGTNMQATGIETIEVNGVKYIKEGTQVTPPKPGKRAVVVVDRGWIFAGDVTREGGRIKLSRAVHVRSWQSVGFDGLIADVKSAKACIKPISDVDMPDGAEIFCVPVGDSWGL